MKKNQESDFDSFKEMGKPNERRLSAIEQEASFLLDFLGCLRKLSKIKTKYVKYLSLSRRGKTRRARKCSERICWKIYVEDPRVVTPDYSKFVMNLLYSYCYRGTPEALSDDIMGGFIQGLRNMYTERGHRGPRRVDTK